MNVSISGHAPSGWDSFLASNPYGTFFQTGLYADYARKEAGLKPFFLRAEENSAVKGQLLLFKGSRYQSGLANLPFSSLTTRVARSLFPSFSWAYGPVAESASAANALLEKAREVSKGRMVGSCHPLQPFVLDSSQFGLREKKWATFLIDLNEAEDVLWSKVDKAARKLVTRTMEQVEIKQVEHEEEYRQYHSILTENRKRSKVIPYKYSTLLWKIWRESGTGGIFIAVEKTSGKVIAGLGISCFNGYVNEWGAGTSNYAFENHVYAQDAIKWAIVKWAKEKGFRYFDLTGVNPSPQSEKERGIFRFKEKWGGKLKEYSMFSRST
ncbi:TPA: peptidoglycan bridge formation glycyltransferase FemA/FemB family protein [Candidatus Micrarchaeota archaeon]|nr:peptidoglycan bridge formation glycyltransferase FemA/FemB family protein [Candidatus Micrarchaeota archaeon]